MKIILVTDAWSPQVNGVVTTFNAIIPLLKKSGYDVEIIEPGLFKTLPLPFYPEIRLALFPRRKLEEFLKTDGITAVHIATEGVLGFVARAVCMRRKIPFTTSYHTHFSYYLETRIHTKIFNPLLYAILRHFHAPATQTLVATEDLRRDLQAHGFHHVEVWPLGVDSEFFKRSAFPPLLLPHPVFVYCGRLAKEKNVEEFLRAKLPGSKVIIGDGPLRKYFEHSYADSIHFVGYRQGQSLVEYLSLGDVFVFPSRSETFGLVMLEALACGLPVAAHNVRGPREIITNGVDGILDDDLEKAALEARSLDGAICRATAMRYSWQHSTEVFLGHLAFLA